MATIPPGDRAAEGVEAAGGAAARSLFLWMWRGRGPDGVIKTEPPGRRWASRGPGSAVGTRCLSSRRGTARPRVRCAGLLRPLAAPGARSCFRPAPGAAAAASERPAETKGAPQKLIRVTFPPPGSFE